jgi:hypothetical protein
MVEIRKNATKAGDENKKPNAACPERQLAMYSGEYRFNIACSSVRKIMCHPQALVVPPFLGTSAPASSWTAFRRHQNPAEFE